MREYLLENYDLIVSIFLAIISLLFGYFRTRSCKKKIKEVKEDMKFKTYSSAVESESPKQEFQETIPDYVLNESTNELERLAVDKNVQAIIQSYIDTALERALERFLPGQEIKEVDDIVERYNESQLDLAELGSAFDKAEEYRQQFGLGDDCSVSDIFAKLSEFSESLKGKIATYNKGGAENAVSEKGTDEKKE